MNQHACLVALWTSSGWRGALITGASGVGKSDLVLRCLSQDFRLVADDRCTLFLAGGQVFGTAPRPLAGLLEIRGVGIGRMSHRPMASIDLLVACLSGEARPERIPENDQQEILGVPTPRIHLNPLEASAVCKVRLALERSAPESEHFHAAS
jgi:serine kinase of HPr protein (carbohydrate metabolism regulator)